MKTMKLIMIATLLTFTAVSIANADGLTSKPVMSFVRIISFEKAVQNPGLVVAMNQQLNIYKLVQVSGQTSLTVGVRYENVNYRISGTIKQWEQFLSWKRPSKKFDPSGN